MPVKDLQQPVVGAAAAKKPMKKYQRSRTARTATKSDGPRNGSGAVASGTKHVTFMLDREEYAVRITSVREIVRLLPITPLPAMSPYLRGVVNLRGQVIPVVDLRIRLGLPTRTDDDSSRIVVVEVQDDVKSTGGAATAAPAAVKPIGLLVDRVCQVLPIDEASVVPPPALDNKEARSMVTGLAKSGDVVKVVLDVNRVFSVA